MGEDADKILIRARHRIEVPTVEEAKDLPKVSVSFVEPHVEFLPQIVAMAKIHGGADAK